MHETGLLKRWRCTPQLDDDAARACGDMARALAVTPLVARLLMQRNIHDHAAARAFLQPKLTDLHDPALLPGVERAAQRIALAVAQQQPIVIYGDYDVDGITASAILWHTLKLAGADVRAYVPHRIDEGYGLNCDAIRAIATGKNGNDTNAGAGTNANKSAAHVTPLIISVDCGITACEPAAVARECGADLIITDHHEFDPDKLPEAYALVHPSLPGSAYPFKSLCGAGVAFKLAWQFCKIHCGSERLPEAYRTLLLDLLSLAALGTVADIVPLVGENRIITRFGLGQIKRTRFIGLNAMIDAARLRDEKIDAYHVGFVLGPRLNACGRMGHAKQAVHLLTGAQHEEAAKLASFLTHENDRRREAERAIFEEARQMVIAGGYDSADCRAIVLGKEGWHAGVVGIVASRLVEAFARPVVLLNFSGGDDGEAHGSARSVDGVSIHEAISHCAPMLTSFGGHAMAAGLRLSCRQVEPFRRELVAFVNARLAAEDLVNLLDIDLECSLDELSVVLMEQVQALAPFGRDNRAPVFCVRNVVLEQAAQRMGGGGKHLSLMLRGGSRMMRAVAFGMGEYAIQLPAGVRLDVAFEPKVSEWKGVRRAEMHVKDLRILK